MPDHIEVLRALRGKADDEECEEEDVEVETTEAEL